MITLDTNPECCKLASMLSVVESFLDDLRLFRVLENFPYKTEKVLQLKRKNKYVYSKKSLV
jgi:hypothetical protein